MENQDKNHLKLWDKVRAGNQSAFDEIYKSHVQLLYNYGLQLGADRHLIQDCIQELFIDLWRKKEHLALDRSVKYYLIQSFRRLIIREQQKNKKRPTELRSTDLMLSNSEDQKEAKAITKKKIHSIKSAIELLPKRQKEAIYLKYFERLDYEEIALLMSIQVSAVYKLVSQGIKKIRTNLKET